MSAMNVNQKGNIGLLKVITDLYSKGYHCFLPFDDYCPTDLIALSGTGISYKLQVKFRSKLTRKGVKQKYYELPLSSVVNGKRVRIDTRMIDGWAVFLEDDDKIVYIPVTDLDGMACKNIRSDMTWDWL